MKPLAAGMLCIALFATSCDSSTDQRDLRVLAAASLTDVFVEIADDFEASHPDIDVEVVVAGSSALVAQAIEGAPFDLLATADRHTMARAVDADVVQAPIEFAANNAVLATTPLLADTSLDGLDGLTIAVCAPEVPCGRAAEHLVAELGVDIEPVTLEANVRGVLTKLSLGEVDAGVVYTTDLIVTDDELVPLTAAADADVVNRYPIAVAAEIDPDGRTDADAFVAFLLGPEGRARLARAGFGTP